MSSPEPSTLKSTLEGGAPIAIGLAVAASALLASCFLSGYDKVDDGGGGTGGTSTSVGMASASTTEASSGPSGGDALPLCDTTEYPEGPTGAEPGGVRTAWFALRTIQLGDPDEPTSVPGFDLDRVDSCNEECRGIDPECSRPDFLGELTPEDEQDRCDWPDAVDNTSVYLFETAAIALGATDASLSSQADDGTWSLLLRLSHWNASADDAEVTVAIYATTGFQPSSTGTTSSTASTGTGSGGGGGAEPPPDVPPSWEGTDRWSIDSRSLDDPSNIDTPAFSTDSAYISGGTLVAELGGLFYAGDTRLPIRIASGRLVAPLDLTDPTSPKLRSAVFAGRWPVDDLLVSIGSLLVGAGPFCEQTQLFDQVAERACRLVDVTTESGLGTCSALSFGIRFDAEKILPGDIVVPEGGPPDCPLVTCDDLLAEE